MGPVSATRVLARDRRLAAVHQAGHVVVAAHFGLKPARARIRRVDAPMPDQRVWTGRIQFSGLDILSPLERRTLGCAGVAAELVWRREDLHPDHWIEAGHMSASDWRLSGCEPGEPDDLCIEAIEELQYLLSEDGPLWSDLLRQARQLIIEAR